MLKIGSHVSYTKADGLLGSVNEALSYGANALMIYTGAPQNTRRDIINKEHKELGWKLLKDNGISANEVIVHAPYIVNLANADLEKRKFSIEFLKREVKRVEDLDLKYLVLHPGNYLELTPQEGINNIVDSLNQILKNTKVMILLETMAGKGTEIGRTIDEIAEIINLSKVKDNLGVCLDTCHLNDAGYDINDFDKILDEIDEKIGLNKVKCMHVNDSKNIRGAKKDRHENIGLGEIGFDKLINIIYNKRLEDIPKILETPYIDQKPPYKEEIRMIRAKKLDVRLK